MARHGISDADRFFGEAVDSVPDSPDRCVNLTSLAKEENFDGAAACAEAWERAGYGVRDTSRNSRLVFAFSEEGYARARTETDRLAAFQAAHARRRWRWPEFDGTSWWVAGAAVAIAALYHFLIGE